MQEQNLLHWNFYFKEKTNKNIKLAFWVYKIKLTIHNAVETSWNIIYTILHCSLSVRNIVSYFWNQFFPIHSKSTCLNQYSYSTFNKNIPYLHLLWGLICIGFTTSIIVYVWAYFTKEIRSVTKISWINIWQKTLKLKTSCISIQRRWQDLSNKFLNYLVSNILCDKVSCLFRAKEFPM